MFTIFLVTWKKNPQISGTVIRLNAIINLYCFDLSYLELPIK